MSTITVTQTYTHLCDVAKGSAGELNDLIFNAAPAAGESFNRGALVTLDADGELVNGGAEHTMPMWAKNASDDYDVSAEVNGTTGGQPGCIVATGGYEIYTTEFVSGQTYTPGSTLLTYSTGDNAGSVEPAGTYHSDVDVVGCVSSGTKEDESYSQSVLYFWPMFIPRLSTAS